MTQADVADENGGVLKSIMKKYYQYCGEIVINLLYTLVWSLVMERVDPKLCDPKRVDPKLFDLGSF